MSAASCHPLSSVRFAYPFKALDRTITRDTTARMAADDHDSHPTQALHSRAFLDAVVESVPAMLVVKNGRDGRFVLINRAGEELLGVPREALMGRNDAEMARALLAAR